MLTIGTKMKLKLPLLFLLLSFYTKAQTGISLDAYSKADELVNSFLSEWKIKGGSVALTKNGKLIYNQGFGFTGKDETQPVMPSTLFRVASVSKPITSIAIMKLVDDGYLSLKDTVFGEGRILDQPYYLQAISDRRIYTITIQQLLEHTAGWDRMAPSEGFSHSDSPFFPLHVTTVLGENNPVGDSTLVKYSLRNGLNNDPGSKYVYSNTGYLVLGKVIEKLSGMSYATFVEKEILRPLGIYDIRLGNNLPDNKLERESCYFSEATSRSCYGTGERVPAQYGGFNLEAMNAHGGWVASAGDLTKLLLAVDGFTTSPDLIQTQTFELMTSPGSVNAKYAKGWSVNKSGNMWHSGSLPGTASFICSTHDGYTTAFLFNSRADNSKEFWHALEKLNLECRNALSSAPAVNMFPPVKSMSNMNITMVNSTSANVNWLKGTGDARIIIASEDSLLTAFPKDGSAYISNAVYGKGTELNHGSYVVYNGSGNKFTLKNLGAGKKYFLYGIEYNKNEDTAFYEVYKVGGRGQALISPKPVFVAQSTARK